MKYTLLKLSEGFVIYKNETIPYNPNGGTNGSFVCLCELEHNDDTKWVSNVGECGGCRPLLAASFVIPDFPTLNQIDFSSLSPEEQKEIGWVDIEELAIKDLENYFGSDLELTEKGTHYINAFYVGFQKAQELLSDRKFTLDDIKKALKYGSEITNNKFKYMEDYIKTITQPISWDIEVELTNHKTKILKLIHEYPF